MERLDAKRVSRLLEAGQGLLADMDLGLVLDRLLELARELIGARYAALGILNEPRTELEQFLTAGIDEETHRAIGDLPRGRGILGVLIEEPEPLRLHDAGTHPKSYGFPPAHPPMRTFLGVPILIRGEAWGNLYLTEKEGGEDFDEADEASAVVLAGRRSPSSTPACTRPSTRGARSSSGRSRASRRRRRSPAPSAARPTSIACSSSSSSVAARSSRRARC